MEGRGRESGATYQHVKIVLFHYQIQNRILCSKTSFFVYLFIERKMKRTFNNFTRIVCTVVPSEFVGYIRLRKGYFFSRIFMTRGRNSHEVTHRHNMNICGDDISR